MILIALIFRAQGADLDVGLGGTNEILERRINEGRLRVYVEERRSSAFEAEGETIGPANSCSRGELWDVAIAQFAVTGRGVLFVRSRDGYAIGVFQGEFYGMFQREWLR